jgi:fatty acid-binding protein DegV
MAVPADVDYLIRRAAMKGERSVSALAAFAAKTLAITPILHGNLGQTAPVAKKLGLTKARESMLETVARMIEARDLISPHVCLSYGGDLEEVKMMPGYARLLAAAASHSVRVHLAVMSMTASVNVGPRALSVGVIAKRRPYA